MLKSYQKNLMNISQVHPLPLNFTPSRHHSFFTVKAKRKNQTLPTLITKIIIWSMILLPLVIFQNNNHGFHGYPPPNALTINLHPDGVRIFVNKQGKGKAICDLNEAYRFY